LANRRAIEIADLWYCEVRSNLPDYDDRSDEVIIAEARANGTVEIAD
jgi:hypothetical protein